MACCKHLTQTTRLQEPIALVFYLLKFLIAPLVCITHNHTLTFFSHCAHYRKPTTLEWFTNIHGFLAHKDSFRSLIKWLELHPLAFTFTHFPPILGYRTSATVLDTRPAPPD